jgi:hypothetical protein
MDVLEQIFDLDYPNTEYINSKKRKRKNYPPNSRGIL